MGLEHEIVVYAPLTLLLGACSLGLPSLGGSGAKSYVSSAPTIPVQGEPVNLIKIAPQEPVRSQIAVLALPDPIGREKKVREKHYVNGTRQEIVLDAGPGVYGENVIDVSVRTSGTAGGARSALEIGPPSENGIRNEILSRFPDVQMNIVTRPMRNRAWAVWSGDRPSSQWRALHFHLAMARRFARAHTGRFEFQQVWRDDGQS